MYAYLDAMADRTSSNVRDIARRAAEDRRDRRVVSATPSPEPSRWTGPEHLTRVVATHHKTGTALMRDVFSHIASDPRWAAKYGPFADVRWMEDHPERSGVDESRAAVAAARIVLDYHLGKQLPEFMLARGHRGDGLDGLGDGDDDANDDGDGVQGTSSKDGVSSVPRECASLVSTLGEYRAVHVVRDPTQVLISGYLYHRRLPGDERWLFEPSPELGGGTPRTRLPR